MQCERKSHSPFPVLLWKIRTGRDCSFSLATELDGVCSPVPPIGPNWMFSSHWGCVTETAYEVPDISLKCLQFSTLNISRKFIFSQSKSPGHFVDI